MDLRIKKVGNGYIVQYDENKSYLVFEERDSDEDEIECMRDLLYFIKEYLGVIYSKHNKRNLLITIENQDEEVLNG